MSKGISVLMNVKTIIFLILLGFILATVIWWGYFIMFKGFIPF